MKLFGILVVTYALMSISALLYIINADVIWTDLELSIYVLTPIIFMFSLALQMIKENKIQMKKYERRLR